MSWKGVQEVSGLNPHSSTCGNTGSGNLEAGR